MGWLCRECSNYNDDAFEKCIVCDADRPDITLLTLTSRIVADLRLTGVVLIPVDYAVIGENAFKDRTDITCVILHENVKKIGKNAFYGCTNLREIRSYASLETISTKAFYNCSSLPEEYKLGAEYLAPDAYGSTLEDLKKSALDSYGEEHEDYYLKAGEKVPTVKVDKRRIKVKEKKEDRKIETPAPVEIARVEIPEVLAPEEKNYETNNRLPETYRAVIAKQIRQVNLVKSPYLKTADISTVLAICLLPVVLFFFIAHFTSLFSTALNFAYISLSLFVGSALFSLCSLLSNVKSEGVAYSVNCAIGALFTILSLLGSLYLPQITVLCISLNFALSILFLCLGLVSKTQKTVYGNSKYFVHSVLSFVICGISLACAISGLILLFH